MILIIAYGNTLRRDDGAGLVFAEKLERLWRSRQLHVQRITAHQLTPELAQLIADEEVSAVVFVDSRAITPKAGNLEVQVHRLAPDVSSPSLGHHSDPSMLMLYAHWLYGRQPPAWTVTVPGLDFDHGEGLSEIAENALANVQDLHGLFPHI